jgi:hypothetical protein
VTQAAAQLDFIGDGRAYCGATFNPVVSFWEDTAETEPTDLSGKEFRMLIFKSVNTAPIAELISSGLDAENEAAAAGTMTVQGTDNNQLRFLLTDGITLAIVPGRYEYHVEQYNEDGTVDRRFFGAIFFEARNNPA